jgi:hypothetical protein
MHPSCGFLNEGSEKFCGGCGGSLTLAPSPPSRGSAPLTADCINFFRLSTRPH